MELYNELKGLISSELGIPISEVTDELAAGDIDVWDSIGHLKLILSIEERFNVKFRTEQISDLVTVKKIYEGIKLFGVSSIEC